jgi:4-amino-4-deoxy-L-arabinose transferase-like glycosyltransferase
VLGQDLEQAFLCYIALMRVREAAFLALLALPFFVGLGESSLWDANEAFYTQTPREMMERGDWVVPYFNGRPRLNKPPLSYWIVGASYQLFGVSIPAARLPMALLAFGSVLAVFRIGKHFPGRWTPLLAAGVFATTFRFLMLSRRLFIDVLLLFCILWAIAFFLSWHRSRRRGHFLAFAAFLGLGVLAKGPVALIPLVPLAAFLRHSGSLAQLLKAPYAKALLLFTAISSSWFAMLAFRQGIGPVADFVLNENLGRYGALDFGPKRGAAYYLWVFLGDFFPWSILFVGALAGWLLWRRREGGDPQTTFLLVWIGTYLVFFSLSANKQEYYILPVYPAAALFLAVVFQQRPPPRFLTMPLVVLVPALAGFLGWAAADLFRGVSLVWLPMLPLAAAGILLGTRRWRAAAACLALFYAAAFSLYLRPMEQYKPVAHFARTIRSVEERAGEKAQAGYFNLTSPSLAYYLNRPVMELYDLEEAAAALRRKERTMLIVEARDFDALCDAAGFRPEIVEQRPKLYTTARRLIARLKSDRTDFADNSWTRTVYLVSNRPDF